MDQRTDARAPRARAMALGSAIRRHRGELTQAGLAIKVSHSQSAISQWETGIIQVSCEQVVEVERVLGLRQEPSWSKLALSTRRSWAPMPPGGSLSGSCKRRFHS